MVPLEKQQQIQYNIWFYQLQHEAYRMSQSDAKQDSISVTFCIIYAVYS